MNCTHIEVGMIVFVKKWLRVYSAYKYLPKLCPRVVVVFIKVHNNKK